MIIKSNSERKAELLNIIKYDLLDGMSETMILSKLFMAENVEKDQGKILLEEYKKGEML
jgi:hypothetical protein